MREHLLHLFCLSSLRRLAPLSARASSLAIIAIVVLGAVGCDVPTIELVGPTLEISPSSGTYITGVNAGYSPSATLEQSDTITPVSPSIAPGGGTYTTARTVVISDGSAGATIYYTLDGTLPSTSSPVYSGSFTTPSTPNTEMVRAVAVLQGVSSSLASQTYTITPMLAAPTFSPGQGTYSNSQKVALTAAAPGQVIYYTTDGSVPTANSPVYQGTLIPVGYGRTMIQAMVGAIGGYVQSNVTTQTYSVSLDTPYMSPAAGTYTSAQTVKIADASPGCTIYYTTDGSSPTTSSRVYTTPLTTLSTSGTETIQALAVGGNIQSSTKAATYIIAPILPGPVFSPLGGSYATAQSVSLSAPSPGQTIYYTIGGTAPTLSSPVYAGPIQINGGQVAISAMVAGTPGYSASATVTQSYAVNPKAPLISPASGTYTTARPVSIFNGAQGATIYYTTDGSVPTTSSPVYTGSFSTLGTSNTETVRAFAILQGLNSPSASQTYTITPPLGAPTFSPAQGNYTVAQNVVLSATAPGTVIYYTVDGSVPTTASPVYAAPIAVGLGQATTIEAIVGATSGYTQSAAGVQIYSVYPANPVMSPVSGTYDGPRTVSITDASPGTIIYYTTDGSTPSTSSAVYKNAFNTLSSSGTETVSAIAMEGSVSSGRSIATYSITPPLPAPTFSPVGGTYNADQRLTLAAPSPGQTIYYTLDGTTPGLTSPVYSGTAISFSPGRVVVKAMVAGTPGYSQSPMSMQAYTIIPNTPYISPAPGTFTTARRVNITDASQGATIYYTIDGTTPTTNSPVYTGPFSTPSTATTEVVHALAVEGGVSSSVTSATYIIAPLPIAPVPVITPNTGSYSTTQIVSMTDSLPGSSIYYTLDGTNPTGYSTRYAGPFSFATNQTGTYIVKAAAYLANYQWSSIAESDVTLALPVGVIGSTTVSTTPVDTIATNFLGFSHDFATAAKLVGDAELGVNTLYRTLLGTLASQMNGQMVVRVGGGGTDTSGTATPATVEPFIELAQAENVSLILGVNLGSDDINLAEEQAQVFVANLPSSALAALEIGNEPDGYSSNGLRPSSYGYSDFLPEYQEWYQGIGSVTPGVPIAGPTFGTGNWIANADFDVADAALPASIITQHKYIACYYADAPLASDILLQPSSANASLWAIRPYAAIAHQAHLLFRMDEINSICLGGQPGVSNSFSSALWAVDNMFEYANAGIDGVNWHTDGQGGAYDLFHFNIWNNGTLNIYTLDDVRPLYYGLLFFAEAAGNTAQLLPASTLTNSNIKVWVTTDSTGMAHLVIINKEQSTAGSVQIALPGYSTGSVVRLTAAGYLSTTGVTIGGQTYDGSTDGTLQGTPTTEVTSPSNGVWTIPVNAMSAVLVNLQP